MRQIHGFDEEVCWSPIGGPDVIGNQWGKFLRSQRFRHDKTGAEDDFIQFGQKNYAMILPITTGGEVVMVKEFKHGCSLASLQFPAGTLGPRDDDLETTAQRELEEETGYRAKRFIGLGKRYIATGSSPTFFRMFAAIECTHTGERKPDVNEFLQVFVASVDEAFQLARAGELFGAGHAEMLHIARDKGMIRTS